MGRVFFAFFATATITAAQTFATRFEVASTKPSKPGTVVQDMRLSFENDRFEAINITLKVILSAMSGFSASVRIEGGPNWTATDRYDIVAKADRAISVNDRNGAVMSLLADRFKLITQKRRTSQDSRWQLARWTVPYSARKKRQPIRSAVTAITSSSGCNYVSFSELPFANLAYYDGGPH
jgi:hypothetical protein